MERATIAKAVFCRQIGIVYKCRIDCRLFFLHNNNQPNNLSLLSDRMKQSIQPFWSISQDELWDMLNTTVRGLSGDEVIQRRSRYGLNAIKKERRYNWFLLLLGQFKSPIILILLFATLLAYFLKDAVDATIILSIILISGLLSFWQERGAVNAVSRLLDLVQIKVTVLRDGRQTGVPVEEIVPGDVVILNAGDIIPADCRILESRDLFVDEAMLTGETFPVAKEIGEIPASATLNQRTNSLFTGTHVISGTAHAIAVVTGAGTEFGKISERLKLQAPETEFERGIRRFGYLVMEITLLLIIAIFAINVYFHRPMLDALLFALALAVGLTPQLLPAIISINLSHGARKMAEKKVVVKRLASIENFGSMNVLCSDKTGTLTEGSIKLHKAMNAEGEESTKVFKYAYLNSFYETGYTNPIDEAVRAHAQPDIADYQKLDEIPYDFIRKKLTVLVGRSGSSTMITKGALHSVLDVCTSVEKKQGIIPLDDEVSAGINRLFEDLGKQGLRTLGLAYRNLGIRREIGRNDESAMTFLGLIVFYDPLKSDITGTIEELRKLGVNLKIITGDNKLIASSIGNQLGLQKAVIITGAGIAALSDEALVNSINSVDILAEVEPNQKERIVIALQKAGNVVGYIGDGINDASALHAADVGISVDSAADVAKEAADIVLLDKDLHVLEQGIREGRTTFANTLKYVFMATSANFGNMFSMAGASLIMPFLPLLPKQILLTNLLTDMPEMTIATDNVDRKMTEKPRRWDIRFIRNFMLTFGLLSSVFDFITFGILLLILGASPEQFRAGWFVESVISASVIVLIIRTRRFFLKSRPGKYLVAATCAVIAAVLIIPYTSLGTLFGFAPLPIYFLLLMGLIIIVYAASAELAKTVFYRRYNL